MMEHFYQLPHMGEDYFTYPHLYRDMVQEFGDGSHFVELGGFKGKSTAYMAVEIINSGKRIRFDCIDLFIDCPQGSGEFIKSCFLNNIQPVKHVVNLFIGDSAGAARCYVDESIHFIFLDADHTYEGVGRDITCWLPKIAVGGILAGHDYEWTGVRQAVSELLPQATNYKRDPHCWFVRK